VIPSIGIVRKQQTMCTFVMWHIYLHSTSWQYSQCIRCKNDWNYTYFKTRVCMYT